MRNTVFVILSIMVIALIICARKAKRSEKSIGRPLSRLLVALIPPIAGNLIIMASTAELPAMIGSYIYFIGLDITVAYLLEFTLYYCDIKWENKVAKSVVYILFSLDFIQYALNPFLGHAFSLEKTVVDNAPYFSLVPGIGQTYHRIVVYGIFLASLVLFMIKVTRTSRIYAEKYLVIALSMVLAGLWETFYIVSGAPIDTSMIGFGVFGLLVFYFSLYYKPVMLVDRMLASIASEMDEALFFFNENNECIWANGHGLDLLGIDGTNLENVYGMLRRMFPNIQAVNSDWSSRQSFESAEGVRYYHLEKRTVMDKKKCFAGSFISIEDITDAQEELRKEQYLARYDQLTGLYNKDYLFRCIRERLHEDPEGRYQVSYVDVNEFKLVNDVFGKDFGDYALQKIAEWIAEDNPESWLYGRIGGDTFGVFQPVDSFNAGKINRALSSFVVSRGDIEHHMLIHVGVYVIDDPDIDVSIMFDRARMALNKIKRTYSHISYYNESIKEMMLWNQQISNQLDDAIKEKQIVPYLQPIVDVNGKIAGCEALARWIHPEKGFLPPSQFVPVFEQNGRIADIDRYMWRCAAETLKEWETTHPGLFISVNISPIDFFRFDVRKEINDIVRKTGIDARNLRLEITESVMMSDADERLATISGLRDDGFIIEMDDFGSGYSSLNMLKDLPADLIKLDMVFLRKSENDNKTKIILNSIIKLIDSLGIESLTEGVETEDQFRSLSGMGCKLFQGFHFAKPMPVEDFDRWCKSQSA